MELGSAAPGDVPVVCDAESDATLDRLPLGGHPLAALEQAAIKQTLLLTHGNKVQAARILGIAVSTLYEKLKKQGA